MMKKILIVSSLAVILSGCSQNPSMVKQIRELKAEQIKKDKEKPAKKIIEKVTKKNTTKEELLETVQQGTSKFFAMAGSYADYSDSISLEDKDGNSYSYAAANEEFTSYEKVENHLSPYWSKKTINYLFNNIAKTIDGVVYFKYGNFSEMEDLNQTSSLELRDLEDFKILRVEAPFYEDEDVVSEYIFTYERGRWVIEEINYTGFNSITEDIKLKFEARKKDILGESNYERN